MKSPPEVSQPETTQSVKARYERFPYPPLAPWSIPRAGEGEELSYELGQRLCFGKSRTHEHIRILVVGCGSFEALVVAQQHPFAEEVVAVDLSEKSLLRLKWRMHLQKLVRPFKKIARIRLIRADFRELDDGGFDYILASNVLHHLPNPAASLALLSAQLKAEGVLRVVTYPKTSRIFMRETAAFFAAQGLHGNDHDLLNKCRQALHTLPHSHRLRTCFSSQSEIFKPAGLVDAFFHPLENALSPWQWKEASLASGLTLGGESQVETSRSEFLDFILPELALTDPWVKLQILDDLLELCSNPIWWFFKSKKEVPASPPVKFNLDFNEVVDFEAEIAQARTRVESLLSPTLVTFSELRQRLREKIGPRIHFKTGETLPGLSLSEVLEHAEKID